VKIITVMVTLINKKLQCGSGTVKRKGRDLIAMAAHRHSVLGLF